MKVQIRNSMLTNQPSASATVPLTWLYSLFLYSYNAITFESVLFHINFVLKYNIQRLLLIYSLKKRLRSQVSKAEKKFFCIFFYVASVKEHSWDVVSR
jgi:hypothetical protein